MARTRTREASDRRRRSERAFRRALFEPLIGFWRTPPLPSEAVDLAGVERVLVVRVNDRLGNLLLVTPALAAVRRALPAARIDLVCARRYASLLAADPHLDRVIPFPVLRYRMPVLALARLARRLRRQRYDLVIDCARGSSFLGALCSGLSGGRLRVAHAGGRYAAAFNVHVVKRTPFEHKVELVLDLLDGIGIPAVTRDLMLGLTDEDRVAAAETWRALGLPGASPVVGVHVGGRGAKRWSLDSFLAVVERLVARGAAPVLLFAGPEERRRLDRARGRIPAGAVRAPALGVRAFAALVARCACFVSGDTGPMHLAAAVGVPTVSILTRPHSRHYRPRGARHRALFDEAGVPPDAVVAAIEELRAGAAGCAAAGSA